MCVHSSWHCAQNCRKSPLHFSRRLKLNAQSRRNCRARKILLVLMIAIVHLPSSNFYVFHILESPMSSDTRCSDRCTCLIHCCSCRLHRCPDCVIVCALCLIEKFLICAIVGRTKEHIADVPPRVVCVVLPSVPVPTLK